MNSIYREDRPLQMTLLFSSRRRRVQLHEIAVEQIAHRLEWAGHHAVAVAQAAGDLEVAFAGDPDLDRLKHGAAVADDKDPFDLLTFLAGEQLRRRRDRRRNGR